MGGISEFESVVINDLRVAHQSLGDRFSDLSFAANVS